MQSPPTRVNSPDYQKEIDRSASHTSLTQCGGAARPPGHQPTGVVSTGGPTLHPSTVADEPVACRLHQGAAEEPGRSAPSALVPRRRRDHVEASREMG